MAYTTIDKPSKYFNTLTYTGNASYPRSITGVGFKPDFTWIKTRSSASFGHSLTDAVRGANNILLSESTGAEFTNANNVNAFASDGFTLGNTNYSGYSNSNAENYVAWNWLGSNTTASNTAGSITSTVSANTTSGFSIVSYTGNGSTSATVGHGLGVTPEVLIIKNRTNAYNWAVYHKDLGNTGGCFLNSTSAFTTDADLFNNTSPTSSLVTFSNSTLTNQGSANHIMYAFNSVKGFSKFGKYTGNGSADGTFIYTGFKPAFFLNKRTDTTSGVWFMFDNKRADYNVVNKELYANTSDAEATADRMDFLSNGFKCRSTSASLNASGGTYIYMAFAENPFTSSKGIPCTAR